MNNINKTGFLVLAVSLLCHSCVPLKEVGQFATTAQKNLDQGNATGYGYKDYSYDSCWLYNKAGASLKEFDCDGSQPSVFDSLVKNEYSILSAYFAALAKLADPSTSIDVSPIGGSVKAGTYGSLTITADESGIAGGIAIAATDLLTTHYKSGKIKEVILKYNDSIRLAIENLQLHIDNLRGKIRLMNIELMRHADLLVADSHSDAEKWTVTSVYKQRSKEWAAVVGLFDARYEALTRIQKGHMELAGKVNDLHSESLKKTILDLAGDISSISGKTKH